MWIYSYKTQENLLAPECLVDLLRRNFIQLKQSLIDNYGDKFKIHMECSMHSEACYLFVECKRSKRSYKVSFRSHDDYYDEPGSDYIIFLHKFRTWDRSEKCFLRRCLPIALGTVCEKITY